MQEDFIKACTGKASDASVVTVAVLLGLVLLATLTITVLNIRRAIRTRGRINKL